MVIHERGELPFEVPGHMDSKNYIVVKNHVRELSTHRQSSEQNCSTITTEDNPKRSTKKRKKTLVHSSDNVSETLTDDLEELRTVYQKCKSIIAKIESKYGHLLNLDNEDGYSNKKLKIEQENCECNCVLNKKIIFDDDGKQINDNIQENPSTTHICPKHLQTKDPHQACQPTLNVTVEEENFSEILPDNLIELSEILKKSDISNTFRNHVIEKVKYIRHQNSNTIKFDKSSLIKQVKSDPSDVISFKGANLSTLQGYPEPT